MKWPIKLNSLQYEELVLPVARELVQFIPPSNGHLITYTLIKSQVIAATDAINNRIKFLWTNLSHILMIWWLLWHLNDLLGLFNTQQVLYCYFRFEHYYFRLYLTKFQKTNMAFFLISQQLQKPVYSASEAILNKPQIDVIYTDCANAYSLMVFYTDQYWKPFICVLWVLEERPRL